MGVNLFQAETACVQKEHEIFVHNKVLICITDNGLSKLRVCRLRTRSFKAWESEFAGLGLRGPLKRENRTVMAAISTSK